MRRTGKDSLVDSHFDDDEEVLRVKIGMVGVGRWKRSLLAWLFRRELLHLHRKGKVQTLYSSKNTSMTKEAVAKTLHPSPAHTHVLGRMRLRASAETY
jgi:hypothetical protein